MATLTRRSLTILVAVFAAGCASGPPALPGPQATLRPTTAAAPRSGGTVLFGRGIDTTTYEIQHPIAASAVGEEVYAVGLFDPALATGPVRVLVTLNGVEIAKYDDGSTDDTDVTAYWLIVPGDRIGAPGTLGVVISDFGNQPAASGRLPINPP